MIYIFINNYRGFSHTILPIYRVNFLVGENSTGKTSLLALLELLSISNFFVNFDFNLGSYEFGSYNDIVSHFATDKTEFQVGICKAKKGNEDTNACYMLNFSKGKDSLPQLNRFSLICSKCVLSIDLHNEKQPEIYISTDVPGFADGSSVEDCFEFLHELRYKKDEDLIPVKSILKNYLRKYLVLDIPEVLERLYEDLKISSSPPTLPFPGLQWMPCLAPIRTTPKRTYDGYTKKFSPEGEHTPYVLREKLPRGSNTNAFKEALEEFGKESGLFNSIKITQYGKDRLSPFEIKIKMNSRLLRINSVGYGVSQALPIIVELLTRKKKTWLGIQQPEVHLHPKAQAAFGDILFYTAFNESKTLVIETHSDYILDRFRILVREKAIEDFAQVIFFSQSEKGNELHPMVIDSSGRYPEDQPEGFRSFFLQEHKRLLGI